MIKVDGDNQGKKMDTMNIIMQWNIEMNKKLAMKHGVKMNRI